MDFRSQLSAFQSGNNSGNNGGSRDRERSDRSPRGGYHPNNNYYGRGGNDRRRPRDWNSHSNSPNHRGGPPHSRRRFHSPDRDGLGDLRHHGYRICRGIPPAPTTEERNRKAKHLALLVICIEDIPYEHIWKAWCDSLDGVEQDDYYISLVCHAKFPKQVQSEMLRQRLLVHPPKSGRGNSYLDPEFLTRTPNWGSVEITRAMLDLLQAGLKIGNDRETDPRFSANRFVLRKPASATKDIPPVDQFLYVSETCLPVATAPDFFETLQDTTVSWVHARHRKDPDTPKNAYENDQFACIQRKIPGQYRWKADQWVLLCRNHASQIIGMDRPHISYKYQLWQSFREINASDEMYMPTALALLGLLRFASDGEDTQRARSRSQEDDKNNNKAPTNDNKDYQFVRKRPITYTDWTEGMRNPATFAKGLVDFERVARLARQQGCLVARKFAPFVAVPGSTSDPEITGQITVEEWKATLEALRADFPPEVFSQPTPTNAPEDAPQVNKSTEVDDKPKETANGDDGKKEKVEEEEEEEEEGTFVVADDKDDKNEEENEDEDDDDEEENQL